MIKKIIIFLENRFFKQNIDKLKYTNEESVASKFAKSYLKDKYSTQNSISSFRRREDCQNFKNVNSL